MLVAALADRMLRLAGSLADGTVLWMTGPVTVADHIVPFVTKAATPAGRPAPRVVVGLPFLLTNDITGARAGQPRRSPSTASSPPIGPCSTVRAPPTRPMWPSSATKPPCGRASSALRDAAATDVDASPFGTREESERTLAFLASHPL